MARFCPLFSGSSGNCTYIGTPEGGILIDAGVSAKRIETACWDRGIGMDSIRGIFVTHEHSDHIKGLGVLARKHHVPIYGTEETLKEIAANTRLGEYPKELLHPILPDVDFQIGDLTLEPFSIHHDAANPVAYRVSHERKSVAVATDMGHYDQYVIDHLKDLDALLLEANHDVNMLETGPYPYYLKRRILGDHGHLSNENAGRLLNYILNDKLKYVLLGHLSKENNYEALAYETVRFEIDQGDTPYKAKDFPIEVAKRDEMSQIIHL